VTGPARKDERGLHLSAEGRVVCAGKEDASVEMKSTIRSPYVKGVRDSYVSATISTHKRKNPKGGDRLAISYDMYVHLM
jgi:hypothetical protein